MQEQVKAEPRRVAELRATFLKLAGAMEGAMVRLGEAGSRDLYSVSQYYSRRLVSYIRRVLQVRARNQPMRSFHNHDGTVICKTFAKVRCKL